MQDLQLIGVHEDGEQLLLGGADGARFRVRVDEPLRAAIRRDRPRLGQLQIEIEGQLRPRDVQALIRSGAPAEEAADRAGWSVDKVHRYAGPILAERENVARLARAARLRSRIGVSRSGVSSGSSAPTLSERVAERLKARDVEVTDAGWDSWRAEGGPWTVVLTFAAGGRQRQASWTYDLADRTVSAIDDEARWLSEEVQPTKGSIPAPHRGSPPDKASKVYDLEAEGGLRPTAGVEHPDDPLDLMTAMRERSTARGRRRPGGGRTSTASTAHASEPTTGSPNLPGEPPASGDRGLDHGPDHGPDHGLDHGLPMEALAFDPETMPPRSGAQRPDPSGFERQPEPANDSDRAPEPMETTARRVKPKDRAARPAPREAARKTARPSVPAWDDIMFGARPGSDRSSS